MKNFDKRGYKFKNVCLKFFCPLCRSERAIATHHKLTRANYIQISILTALTSILIGLQGLIGFFIYWAIFEFTRKSLFKRDIPCPHCGFDASWYKRDVKVARSRVADFWKESDANLAAASSQEAQEDRLESALNS